MRHPALLSVLRHSSTIFVIIQVLESLWEVHQDPCSVLGDRHFYPQPWPEENTKLSHTETAEKCMWQTVTWLNNTYFPVKICQMMGPSPKKATKRTSGEALTSTSPEPEYYPEDGQEDGTGDDYKNKRARYRKYVRNMRLAEFRCFQSWKRLNVFETFFGHPGPGNKTKWKCSNCQHSDF